MPRKLVLDDSIFDDKPTSKATVSSSVGQQTMAGTERATLNLTITPDERWAIKEWSTRHRMTIVDVMREGFELMKQKYGE